MNFFSEKENIRTSKNNGFAIPQILLLGIGIAIGIGGLINSSIISLTGSRINRQELLAKASSYSGITRFKALLNDNTKDRLFNYFWIVDNCSENSIECSSQQIAYPPNEYWADDKWCNEEDSCKGRQKAPLCPINQNISWIDEQSIVAELFNKNDIGKSLENTNQDFKQTFNIISSKYIGTEEYGINSILIEGLSSANTKSSDISASNKLRVNIEVSSFISDNGFGFLSAGEDNSDKQDSLYLGNINILPNDAKGSIIWRMNLEDTSDCNNLKELAKGTYSSLPDEDNGGIWIQPLNMPKQPRLKNVKNLETIFCTPKTFKENTYNCNLNSGNLKQKTFRIYSLFVRGPGAIFEVSTSDEKKIILEIMGDIDISNGGLFCHKNENDMCGTGKPENLTILFKQKKKPLKNKLICNRNNNNGGVNIKFNDDYSNIKYPIENNTLPGHSFLIDKTGENENSKFGAFIYGPNTTFISLQAKNKWIQSNDYTNTNNGLIVTSRGSYGYIKNIEGKSVEDKITNLILDPEYKLIPYGANQQNSKNLEIIGIGKKVRNLPNMSDFNPESKDVFLIFDNKNSKYHLRTFEVKRINDKNIENYKYSFPGSFAILDIKNKQNNFELGEDLEKDNNTISWLNTFDIKVIRLDNDFSRNFIGAAWVKNLCFDSNGSKNWEFSQTFIQNLIAWHGEEFNWGRKFYRGQANILWDTLREFKRN